MTTSSCRCPADTTASSGKPWVFAASSWPGGLPDDAILARLLELNLARPSQDPAGPGALPGPDEDEGDRGD